MMSMMVSTLTSKGTMTAADDDDDDDDDNDDGDDDNGVSREKHGA